MLPGFEPGCKEIEALRCEQRKWDEWLLLSDGWSREAARVMVRRAWGEVHRPHSETAPDYVAELDVEGGEWL